MAITTDITWPEGLPCALREGHSTQHGTPFRRTTLASGRARQRRKFTSVPSSKTFKWYMSEAQCMAFEAWFRDVLADGVQWFNMAARTPLGKVNMVCRFAEMYSGPDPIGRDSWEISAQLEIWERPLLPVGWGQIPDYVANSDIVDIAMNREWPEA